MLTLLSLINVPGTDVTLDIEVGRYLERTHSSCACATRIYMTGIPFTAPVAFTQLQF